MTELHEYVERVQKRRNAYLRCSDEQALVYACEDIVDIELGTAPLDESQLQEFVFSISHRENIEPPFVVNTHTRRTRASADLDSWTMCVSNRSVTTSVVLHELAHFAVGIDSHGVLFRDELVRLVRAHVSLEHAALLHTLFHQVGLDMSPWAASARRY